MGKTVYVNDQNPRVAYESLEDARKSLQQTIKDWWHKFDHDSPTYGELSDDLKAWGGGGSFCVDHPSVDLVATLRAVELLAPPAARPGRRSGREGPGRRPQRRVRLRLRVAGHLGEPREAGRALGQRPTSGAVRRRCSRGEGPTGARLPPVTSGEGPLARGLTGRARHEAQARPLEPS